MMTSRRQFLGQLGAASVLSIGGLPPEFLSRAAMAAGDKGGIDGRVLVLIQLAGGNDGLNTVIPYGDPAYAKNRPGIAIGEGAVLKIDKYLGLHPQMTGCKQLLDEGVLRIVQGVGYPNTDRSHFRSMDIWHSARPEAMTFENGWVGRALDQTVDRHAGRVPAISLGSERLPLAMVATKLNVPNVQNFQSYRLELGAGSAEDKKRRRKLIGELARGPAPISSPTSELDFLRMTATTAYTSADRLQEVASKYQPAASYPATALAEKLKLIAQIIAGEFGTRIFFVSIDGFDTHSQQEAAHATLLGELSGALRAFQQDLKGHKLDDRVAVATFSEFGRRVKENGSLGTDHGAASQLFVVAPTGKAGVHGKHPSLTDLQEGDLKHHTDFRSVYATLLEKWLGFPSEPVLGGKFPTLDFV